MGIGTDKSVAWAELIGQQKDGVLLPKVCNSNPLIFYECWLFIGTRSGLLNIHVIFGLVKKLLKFPYSSKTNIYIRKV